MAGQLPGHAAIKGKNTLNDLQIFQNDTFGSVRVFIDGNGNPWFVTKDVCATLGIEYHRDAMARLDDDERGSVLVDTLGGPQEMSAVNESGLYSLILRSRKPEAKAFKRWITHEVIPAIRKTGQYHLPQSEKNKAIETIANPSEIINLLSYVVTLRQLARQNIFTQYQKARFLAEAASLLSGLPMSRFLPSDAAPEMNVEVEVELRMDLDGDEISFAGQCPLFQ